MSCLTAAFVVAALFLPATGCTYEGPTGRYYADPDNRYLDPYRNVPTPVRAEPDSSAPRR
jgi:hypothetical protein